MYQCLLCLHNKQKKVLVHIIYWIQFSFFFFFNAIVNPENFRSGEPIPVISM